MSGCSGVPVDGATDCVQAAGFDHVLCAAWNLGDNSGPHNADEVGSMPFILPMVLDQAELKYTRRGEPIQGI